MQARRDPQQGAPGQSAYPPAVPPPRALLTRVGQTPALQLTADDEENKNLPLVAQVKTLSGSTKSRERHSGAISQG